MKHFGAFLSNLRNSIGLSLDELAKLVDSSRSTLSRLENNEVPQPFKGPARKLVIALAEILCTSIRETERYLELASIDRSLLTEAEEIQLGFTPPIALGSSEETTNLERLERIYEQRLHQLAQWVELSTSSSLPNLKRKMQEYANFLREIQNRLSKLQNKQGPIELSTASAVQAHYIAAQEGRLVVGYQYGKDINAISSPNNLYALASPNALWLMEQANVDRFAVDDCILLTKSKNYEGWNLQDIKATVLNTPLPIPNDLEKLRQEKMPEVERNFFNSSHYRLAAYTPMFTDRTHLEITLAPLSFYDYYSLTPFLDEPLLTALDGSKVSVRQKYGNTALTYSSTSHGACLIPAPVNVQGVVVTKDKQIVLMQRSLSVALYPNHWSASFEEAMNAPGVSRQDRPSQSDAADFFACTIRGLDEEFAIPTSKIESIKMLSLNVEYLVLAVGAITVIKVDLTAEEVRQNWMTKARDADEASRLAVVSTNLTDVVDKLFSKILWHPTARMRLIQFLFHTYGVDEVAKVIEKRNTDS
ncbi:MAG TPA: helix-turn-helix transcriptional regulator [Ktedonobacteraceae bacterium]|nr:helix-turn-helix transcriptional regulator [Ktedonobacteraceae bacterium]